MQIAFSKIFLKSQFDATKQTSYEGFQYNPYPTVYSHGYLSGDLPNPKLDKSKQYIFMLMEKYVGYTLHDYVMNKCANRPNVLYSVDKSMFAPDDVDITIQLFYIVSMMQMNNQSHCDLHGKNIYITTISEEYVIDFSHLGYDSDETKYTVKKYSVRLLDLGEGSDNECEQKRSGTLALNEMRNTCAKKKQLNTKCEIRKTNEYRENGCRTRC